MINVGDLVRDTEDNMDIAECFSAEHQNCPMLPACALKSILSEARKSFLATLDFYRLSDITGSSMPPLVAPLHLVHDISSPAGGRKKKRSA